jgi:hypothetical protein
MNWVWKMVMPQQMEGNGTFVIRIIISTQSELAVGGINRGNTGNAVGTATRIVGVTMLTLHTISVCAYHHTAKVKEQVSESLTRLII